MQLKKAHETSDFPSINRGYNNVFRVNRLSIGLTVPIESYPTGPVPKMNRHIERVQLAESLGFSAVWLRDVPLNVPSFGDAGQTLVSLGHHVLLHGRNGAKLESVQKSLNTVSGGAPTEIYVEDLSNMTEVESLAKTVSGRHQSIDVLINNAGVFKVPDPVTADGLDLRFVVNTIAPFLLTQRLLQKLGSSGRVINLSSAAQAPVDIEALRGKRRLDDSQAYAQSKLALTMWSLHLATTLGDQGPAIIAVNPGSFLGSKMVKEAYGSEGKDLGIGARILTRAAVDVDFANASGQYFDNDTGQFAAPHADALDKNKNSQLVQTIESLLKKLTSH